MDARGKVIQSQQGSGVTSNKSYNDATGLLEQVNSYKILTPNIQNLNYQWDTLGNLEHRSDQSGDKNLTEEFTYDNMNRLKTAKIGSNEQTVTYDKIGNIESKTGVGEYKYADGSPHRLATTTHNSVTTEYTYDANGNNISSTDGRELTYSAFDKVVNITKGDNQVTFDYGPDRSRFKRVDTLKKDSTAEIKTTYYLGGVEIVDYVGGGKDGQREYIRRLGSAIETLTYPKRRDGDTSPTETTHYLLHDHLGSLDLITDAKGNVVQHHSFDAWGKRRDARDLDAILASVLADSSTNSIYTNFDSARALNSITTRGFTGHEMVDAVGIIHMNGRIYDPTLGRFLQADPFVPSAYDTQSFNRYAYVRNNPLNATDPSGYFDIITYIVMAVVAWAVGDIVTTIGMKNGWSTDLIRVVSFVATCWIGDCFDLTDIGASMASIMSSDGLMMAVVGGVTSVLGGGKFGHGFITAGISAGGANPDSGGGGDGGAGAGSISGFLTSVAVGGTISKLTGGKFANGAASGAFSYAVRSVQGKHGDKAEAKKAEGQGGGCFSYYSDGSCMLSNTQYDQSIESGLWKMVAQKGADYSDCGGGSACVVQNQGVRDELTKLNSQLSTDESGHVSVSGGDSYFDSETGESISRSTSDVIPNRNENSFHHDHNNNRGIDIRTSTINIPRPQLDGYIERHTDFRVLDRVYRDGHVHMTCNSPGCL